MDKDYRMSQHRQDWGQFKADLDHMVAWLDEVEALHGAQSPGPRDITELDSIIRHHKVRFFLLFVCLFVCFFIVIQYCLS